MRGRLRRQVNYVIHCAASIIFNEHVHTLLANNYEVKPVIPSAWLSLHLSGLLLPHFKMAGTVLDSSLHPL